MFEIYTKSYCPFCHRAKALLDSKDIPYQEYDITQDSAGQKETIQRSGRFTVPQVFFDGWAIGGSDDLFELEQNGELDQLLTEPKSSNA